MNATVAPPAARRSLPPPAGSPSPAQDAGVDRQGRHLQELVERIEAFPDPAARILMQECLQSLLALHGRGLARILQLADNLGPEGGRLREALVCDKLVAGLLLIHGVHPVSLEDRLRGALEKIRPYLESHGGNVELLELREDVAHLQLQGTCQTCPASSITLELAVRHAIEEACPDLAGFQVTGQAAETVPQPPGPCVAAP